MGNWQAGAGVSPVSTHTIKCYHAGSAVAPANLSFKKTYGTYSDSTLLANLWADYHIDDLIITIPRAIRDIKTTFEIASQYNTIASWDTNKTIIIQHLEDNLDSSIAGVLRTMVRATGTDLQYATVVAMRDAIRQNFINGKTYLFSINGIEKQSRIQSATALTHPVTPPGGIFMVDDDISDSTNNKYITLNPTFGVPSNGIITAYQTIATTAGSPPLEFPEVYFRNTYE